MIPKKIHYIWLGGNPLSPLMEMCIESWKKFCPDYEIIKWDETNLDFSNCAYAVQAYEAKKWAFVSDYCRFLVLHGHGGIYLDIDVELLKPLDSFLDAPFTGFEQKDSVNPGLIFACEAGNAFCKSMIDSYLSDTFCPNNLITVCRRATDILLKHGLQLNDTKQEVLGMVIYPTEYFCPISYETGKKRITENTASIHHYAASWVPLRRKFLNRIGRIIGPKNKKRLKKLFGK
ncbi:MAG: hypothetical protein FWD49_01415 [Firmicutes bacterium]|nr:hypothetical protein [Bacillota bacterium]